MDLWIIITHIREDKLNLYYTILLYDYMTICNVYTGPFVFDCILQGHFNCC